MQHLGWKFLGPLALKASRALPVTRIPHILSVGNILKGVAVIEVKATREEMTTFKTKRTNWVGYWLLSMIGKLGGCS